MQPAVQAAELQAKIASLEHERSSEQLSGSKNKQRRKRIAARIAKLRAQLVHATTTGSCAGSAASAGASATSLPTRSAAAKGGSHAPTAAAESAGSPERAARAAEACRLILAAPRLSTPGPEPEALPPRKGKKRGESKKHAAAHRRPATSPNISWRAVLIGGAKSSCTPCLLRKLEAHSTRSLVYHFAPA